MDIASGISFFWLRPCYRLAWTVSALIILSQLPSFIPLYTVAVLTVHIYEFHLIVLSSLFIETEKIDKANLQHVACCHIKSPTHHDPQSTQWI